MDRDQHNIRIAFANLHEALNAICQVRNLDVHLLHVQHEMYVMEDTLYQYMTTKEDKDNGKHL